MSAFATTSSSILVRWFEVPEPDRNGLILGYKVSPGLGFPSVGPSTCATVALLLSSLLAASGGLQREGRRQRGPLLDGAGKRHSQCPAGGSGEVRAVRDPGPGVHEDWGWTSQFSDHPGEDAGRW